MNQLTSSVLYSLFVANKDKNWVFSPASYLEAMSQLALCIKDENLSQLLAAAPDISSPQSEGLDTHNVLLYADAYRDALNQVVVEAVKARGSSLESFDGPAVIARVNQIVREKTNGKIDNLLSDSDFTDTLAFIILNCVYFKKAWRYPFDETYHTEPFVGATKTSKVKYLYHKITGQRYYEGVGYDIVELPYKESDVCCYLIVPTTETVFDIFSDLNGHVANIANVKPGLDVHLTVPPFRTETTIDNLASLTDLAGVKSIFSWNKAWSLFDFDRLDAITVVKVTKILQKAYIDFTKNGTEAAAATAILGAASGCMRFPVEPPPTKYIRADKPFVYVLARRGETKPLFVGVVNDIDDEVAPAPHKEGNMVYGMPGPSGVLISVNGVPVSGVSLYSSLS